MIKVPKDDLPSVHELEFMLSQLVTLDVGRLYYTSAYLVLELALKKLSVYVNGYYNNSVHQLSGYLRTFFSLSEELQLVQRDLIDREVLTLFQNLNYTRLRYGAPYTGVLPTSQDFNMLISLVLNFLRELGVR